MATMPKWSTPERRAQLVKLFQQQLNRCFEGHVTCPDLAHYVKDGVLTLPAEWHADGLVELWRQYDRQEAQLLWEEERRRMHRMPERGRFSHMAQPGRGGDVRKPFDPVEQERWFASRPSWYLISHGFDPLKRCAVARVRIAGTYVNLFVDVELQGIPLSKSQRRKLLRHGKQPQPLRQSLSSQVGLAVAHYFSG